MLCRDHALKSAGADFVARAPGDLEPDHVLEALASFGIKPPGAYPTTGIRPYPAFDLLRRIDYICLMTSSGCPYRCRYCAGPVLNPGFSRRDPLDVLEEILYWHKGFGVRDFAFYDDALLIQPGNELSILLERLIRLNLGLRFHTPNAVHIKEISPDMARLFRRAGFRTIRLGLETTDMVLHEKLDGKLLSGEFETAG